MTTMQRRNAAVGAIVMLVVAVSAVRGAAQAKVDVTGKWAFSVETSAGAGQPTFTFKQDGEKLTGHYSSQTLGEADLTGTVKGADVTFNFMADLQGNAVPVTYKATIESPTSMKGTIDIGGQAGGTFTGKKK